ncbi:MAG TPA: hypothetical protein PKC06_02435 [Saprospiraceae bacterium]|nr:hypothetical protein [Saprospiraceae bacterium]HMT52084.1 hypothetical protein [Saprospiraceae bacterium]
MKNEIPQQLKNHRLISIIILVLGLTLITFMIIVEGELGALPLFLLILGITWYAFTHYQIRKHMRRDEHQDRL